MDEVEDLQRALALAEEREQQADAFSHPGSAAGLGRRAGPGRGDATSDSAPDLSRSLSSRVALASSSLIPASDAEKVSGTACSFGAGCWQFCHFLLTTGVWAPRRWWTCRASRPLKRVRRRQRGMMIAPRLPGWTG